MPTFYAKIKNVVYYRNLKQRLLSQFKQRLNLDLTLTKIHRALQFDQTPSLKTYIKLHTELRKQSTNEFERDFYKFMTNAVFGKTMENPRNSEM